MEIGERHWAAFTLLAIRACRRRWMSASMTRSGVTGISLRSRPIALAMALTMAGFPPAMVNAIANAIGLDLNEIPVTPDRVMEALIQRRRQARLATAVKAAS